MNPILCIVGARPNYMKVAPLMRAFAQAGMPAHIVHTGQHYDADMNDRFFQALAMPAPIANLAVGSASHAVQTAEVMKRFEPVVDEHQPSCVLVVGDVNSTIACALVAAKKGVKVAHVEAGLRSGDRTMPEEINRILTDQLSDFLFTTEPDAKGNLLREGIAESAIYFAGNVMIDTLMMMQPHAVPAAQTLAKIGQNAVNLNRYGLVTLHRPATVDNPALFADMLRALAKVSESLPLIFAVHPRTRANIDKFGLESIVAGKAIHFIAPQGYLELLGLQRQATLVLTDSGGIQEETTALGVPCLTLRDNTERPITISQGTNTLAGRDPAHIVSLAQDRLTKPFDCSKRPEGWDGQAAPRIAQSLKAALGSAE
jgi:UDP-N-acetylglucosamine 2-epimerase (non-hydrolysing)